MSRYSLSFLILILPTLLSAAQADELGRLFYTPQQRHQLDSGTAISNSNSNPENLHPNYFIVNGVVQKHGGNRTVWINGNAQAPEPGNDRNPTVAPVTVPGKSLPVQLKVGQKLILETPAPEEDK